MSKYEFKTEVSDLLNLMIHSLYSNKEIFLRELISNASDALDKLNYLSLTGDSYKDMLFTPQITIKIDSEAKTLIISDNGIGMSESELNENLGTIARSGTKGFMQNLSGDAKKDSSLIGQFGVGFYSAFMVANKIEVISRKALSDKSFIWASDTNGFSIAPAPSPLDNQGTQIILHLNDDEFLQSWRIESIIKKYSNHIPYPIFMTDSVATSPNSENEASGDGDSDKSNSDKTRQINKASALWRLPKSQLKLNDYNDFYSQISHDSTEPLLHIHTKAEGKIEYSTLFYIPGAAPFDLYRVDWASGVKLYVKRVFITDDAKELLPPFLRFVKGVMDVEDIPLNVSREILQENRVLASVKDASVKKILSELAKLMQNDSEKYRKFYNLFGKVIKEGLYGFTPHKEDILNLCLFKSLLNDGLISLADYKANMKEEQKNIFYITGAGEQILRHSPLLEGFKKAGIDVLICDDDVDTIVLPMVGEYDKTPLLSVSDDKAAQNLKSSDADDDIKPSEELIKIIVKLKESLKDKVKDVRISSRLSHSAACLVYDKNDPDFAMQQLMAQMGQEMPKTLPILELNPSHEIFNKLAKNELMINDAGVLLLGIAKLAAAMPIDEPTEFGNKITEILIKALG